MKYSGKSIKIMNKINKNFRRGASFDQKIKRSVFLEPRSKTPDRSHQKILQHKDFRESINNVRSPSIFIPFKVLPDADNNSVIYSADYNFLNKYLELSKGIYPSGFNIQIEVYVRSYYVKEKALGLLNYTMYVVEGKYDEREFQVERRYSEFLSYRDILAKNWPGFFIPPIPPKKAFGSKEEGFLKMRLKYLQQFFNRVFSCPHLTASPETKIFFEPKVLKFLKIPKELYYKSYLEIYDAYEEYLPFLRDYEINDKIKEYVNNFYFLLIRLKENTENYINNSIEAQNFDMELNRNIEKFYEDFYDFENFFIQDMIKLEKDKKDSLNQDLVECKLTENLYSYNYENSFKTIYEWLLLELADVNTMIDSISSIYRYNDLFMKKYELLQRENVKLYKLNNPNFLSNFFFSSDLGRVQQKCFEIEKLGREVQVIKKLSEFMYKIVYYIEIPTYKQDKIKFYYNYIQYITQTEQHKCEKAKLICDLLRDHSTKMLLVFKDYKEKSV